MSHFWSFNVHKNHSVKVQILILQSWRGPRVCILISFQVMLPAQVSPVDGPNDANGSAQEPHLEEQAAREVLFIIAYLLFLTSNFLIFLRTLSPNTSPLCTGEKLGGCVLWREICPWTFWLEISNWAGGLNSEANISSKNSVSPILFKKYSDYYNMQ